MSIWARIDTDDYESEWVMHATGFGAGGEYTACGFATDHWDVAESCGYVDGVKGDDKPSPKDTKTITCQNCIHVLDDLFSKFKKVGNKWVELESEAKADD